MDIDWAKLRRLAGNLIAFSAYLQASCILLGTDRHNRLFSGRYWCCLGRPNSR
jgi:hypothetical protein